MDVTFSPLMSSSSFLFSICLFAASVGYNPTTQANTRIKLIREKNILDRKRKRKKKRKK